MGRLGKQESTKGSKRQWLLLKTSDAINLTKENRTMECPVSTGHPRTVSVMQATRITGCVACQQFILLAVSLSVFLVNCFRCALSPATYFNTLYPFCHSLSCSSRRLEISILLPAHLRNPGSLGAKIYRRLGPYRRTDHPRCPRKCAGQHKNTNESMNFKAIQEIVPPIAI